MTNNFIEFQEFLKSIEANSRRTKDREQELLGLLEIQGNEFNICEIAGKSTQATQIKIDELEAELKVIQRKNQAYNGSIDSIIKSSPVDMGKAKDIIKDNLEATEQLQAEYDKEAEKLKEMKTAFLSKVADIGKIKDTSRSLANEMNLVKKYVPGTENRAFGGVVDGINQLHKTGIVYISNKESEEQYGK